MITREYDVIIVGAGLVGLATAYQLQQQYPSRSLLILEKESDVAKHQSSHNSGVIHSGIYYKPGSLKAQNCLSGYKRLLDFAVEHAIPHEVCGKIIVAANPSEKAYLEQIWQRGVQHGLTDLKKLHAAQLQEYEPHVTGIAGIHVPQTGIIDYPALAAKLKQLITLSGGTFRFAETVNNIQEEGAKYLVTSNKETYTGAKIITCAGLYSDKIAQLSKTNNDLRIIPFRGEYYTLKAAKRDLVKNLIYPVPNPAFPFLGVHFTRMIGGGIEAGPNAVLAFKREGYAFWDIKLADLAETFSWPGFWKIVQKYGKTGAAEIYRSLSKAAFTRSLQQLVPEIQEEDLEPGGAGVRAQACDRKGNLIDDFDIQEQANIIHVRNAPSPAATSCLAIGAYISNKIQFS